MNEVLCSNSRGTKRQWGCIWEDGGGGGGPSLVENKKIRGCLVAIWMH